MRKLVAKTKLKTSILGLPVSFKTSGDLKGGGFGIYQIQSNGTFKRIG